MLVTGIAAICAIGSLICWVMAIITAFQKGDGPLMGILSIVLCALGAFIIGWIHHKEWGHQKLMIIWSALFAANILLQIISVAVIAAVGAAAQ